MCGIAGVLSGTPVAGDTIIEMLEAIRHRGPDGAGSVYLAPGRAPSANGSRPWHAALGHVRLALVGSRDFGRQPSVNRSRSIHSVVNGEIYNHAALRADLAEHGHLVPGDNDCEVVPYLFEQGGAHALGRLSGIFSGAIFDARDRSLTLFRDRFGARPLYYAQSDQTVFFASEVKAILAAPGMRASLDSDALAEYFTFQSPLESRTLFKGIRAVEPGQVVRFVDGRTHVDSLSRPKLADPPETFSDAVVELRQMLDEAVTAQWHPRASAYLSGGVDTNAIVGTLSRLGHPVETLTAEFGQRTFTGGDSGCDESADARSNAQAYGLAHRNVPIRSDDFEAAFVDLIWHLEDLRMPMSFGAWRISELLSPGQAVLLSGMGSDEIFGGYVDRIRHLPPDGSDIQTWIGAYTALWSQRVTTSEERRNAFTSAVGSERSQGDLRCRSIRY